MISIVSSVITHFGLALYKSYACFFFVFVSSYCSWNQRSRCWRDQKWRFRQSLKCSRKWRILRFTFREPLLNKTFFQESELQIKLATYCSGVLLHSAAFAWFLGCSWRISRFLVFCLRLVSRFLNYFRASLAGLGKQWYFSAARRRSSYRYGTECTVISWWACSRLCSLLGLVSCIVIKVLPKNAWWWIESI